jgi:hypothetical protein
MFRGLPAALKRQVCAALTRALDSTTPDPRYGYLSAEERTSLRTLLRETHPDFHDNRGN